MDMSRESSAGDQIRFIDLTHNGGWKVVEERFNRLALTLTATRTASHQLPAVKCSDFGFCIGMQQSPDFANELLRALRGRRDLKNDITKWELHSHWQQLTNSCFNSKLQIFYAMCDRDMDGRINEMDIKQMILLSASTNKLCVTHEEAEDYGGLIMGRLDTEERGYIEICQMETLFRSVNLPSNELQRTTTVPSPNHQPKTKSRRTGIEIWLRSNWRRSWIIVLWLTVCCTLFVWKFVQYRHRNGFRVMGYCLCTAKGAAETLKFNMAIILLPVCRNTITWMRNNNNINSIVPFNDNINFHKLIAGGIVVGVILHGGTHLGCDFPRISGLDSSIFRQTIAPAFGYHQPSYIQILATTEGATGIAMVLLMAIAFALTTKSVRQVTGYNTFWYSHHLFILVYALLIVHSIFLFLTDDALQKTTWMYIAFPVLLYSGERIFRALRSRIYDVQIMQANVYPGKILSLKLKKPDGFRYQSGMYIFIQCPQISHFEWHPFSLTSWPEDDYLSVYIRSVGDWSYQIYSHFQKAILLSSANSGYPKIYIDGPYGAASQDHIKYDIVVMIGLGIGVTPFISILRNIVANIGVESKGPAKAYLYWVTREQSSFDWFRDVIKEISKTLNHKHEYGVEIHNFLTSVYQQGDARSAIITTIQALHHAINGVDIISNTPVRTHFGRPNWLDVFSKLSQRHSGARIGVFYCGASALARQLETLCTKFSTKTPTRFVFHKENY